jgi:hypothetical protein
VAVDTLSTKSNIEFIGTGAQTVPAMPYYNLVIASDRGANDVTFQPGTIDIAGAFLPLATFTAPSGGTAGNYVVTGTTFDYNGAAQTVSSFIYDNLSLDGSGTKTISTSNSSGPSPAVAIAGDLTINPTVAVDTLSTKSNIEFIGTGAQTVPAMQYYNLVIATDRGANDVTFQPGTIEIAGGFAPLATFTAPSGGTAGNYALAGTTFDYNGAAQTVSSFIYNNLSLEGSGTKTISTSNSSGPSPAVMIAGAFSVNPAVTVDALSTKSNIEFVGSGAQTVPAMQYYNLVVASERGANNVTFQPGTIKIAGTFVPLATFTAPSGGTAGSYVLTGTTFEYDGDGSSLQSIAAFGYNNLTIDPRAGSVTFISINSSDIFGIRGAFQPGALTSGGGYTLADSSSGTYSTFIFSGSAAQTVPAVPGADYANLAVYNASGISLGGNITVDDTLTLRSGIVNTAGNTLTVGSAGSISRTSGGGWVEGNLEMTVPAGTAANTSSTTFIVGTAANYTPVIITTTSTSTSSSATGLLTVSVGPLAFDAASGLNAADTVPVEWSVTAPLASTFAGPYDATLTYTGLVPAGVDPTGFAVAQLSNNVWSQPYTPGSANGTAITTTRLSNLGSFIVGLDTVPPVVTLTAGFTTPTNNTTPSFTLAGGTVAGDGSSVRLEVFSGGSPAGTMIWNTSSPVSSRTVTLSSLANGTYMAIALQSDASGNVGIGGPVVFTIDTQGPTASGLSVTTSATSLFPTAQATINDTATGNSNIIAAEYFIDNSSGGPGTGAAMTGSFTAPVVSVSASLTTINNYKNGVHTLYVRGKDAAGNWGPLASNTFTKSAVGPAMTALAVSPSPTSAPPKVTATFSDSNTNNVNIVAAEYFIDKAGTTGKGIALPPLSGKLGGSPTAQVAATLSAATFSKLADGPHTILVHAEDAKNQWSSLASVTFVKDTNGPVVSNLKVSPTSTSTVAPTVTATVSDAATDNLNVVAAEYFIDKAGANGTGTAFVLATPLSPTANLSQAIGAAAFAKLSVGKHTVFVHGKDSLGIWGKTVSFAFTKAKPTMAALLPAAAPAAVSTTATARQKATDLLLAMEGL